MGGVGGCLALLAPASQSDTVPTPGKFDPRIREVAYRNDDVVRLRGHVGYQIHLQWAEGEEFVSLGSGDAGGFDIGAERNHFFIKPRQVHVTTNLTILTTRRAYQFEYSAARAPTGAAARRDMVYSIRFTYPQDEARRQASDQDRQRTDAQLASAVAQRPRNLDYWFCGSPSLRPVTAWDDGVHTRLRFAARTEFPAIFVRNDDGSESLLNFNVAGEDVVVHRVARQLVLRRGQLVGCVVNRAFDGGGQRLGSQTVAPQVQRHTRGGSP